MPTYDYVCGACEHQFEQFQSITAKTLRKCPQCSMPKLKRLIGTGAGVIFKGSGFYETDYRSESYKKAAKADNDSATGKSEKKSDDAKTGDIKPKAADSGGTAKTDTAKAKPDTSTKGGSSKTNK